MKKYTIIAILSIFALNAQAQRRGRGYRQLKVQMASQSALADSIANVGVQASNMLDSLAVKYRTTANNIEHSTSTVVSNELNPYYYPLFASQTLMSAPLRTTIGTLVSEAAKSDKKLLLPVAWSDIAYTVAENYALRPELVIYDITTNATESTDNIERQTQLPQIDPGDKNDKNKSNTAPSELPDTHYERVVDASESFDLSDFHIHIRRPNFWTFKGSFSTQFMQYYVSENWYKGGENHVSMLGMFNFEANYNNKRKVTFANKLETKLGFQSAPSDEYHSFKTNADLLRLTDKLGIQATKRWYYTLMLQSWTQFYKAFKANSETVASDFMSPFESVLSLGMDYKLSKKRVNLTATLSPLAANMKYCDRTSIVKNHGIEEGKHLKFDLGSTVTINMTLKFCEQVNWVTRLYAFHDYKGHLKAEWENTINLKVNKYLSTKLFLYPRYDNNVAKKKPEESYFQFNEYLSVGLDLNF